MSHYLRDTAYILKTEPFRERDVWLTLYGQQHGKLLGIARGVRSNTSKQRGHVEPYSKIEVMIAKGSAQDKIAVAQTSASSAALRSSLAGMSVFGSAVSLVSKSTEQGVPNQRVFELLDELRNLLSGDAAPRISVERSALLFSAFTLHLLSAEGYGIEFTQCRLCRTNPTPGPVWLALDQGGILCSSCLRGLSIAPTMGEWIAFPVLQTIRFLLRQPLGSVLALSAPRSVLLDVTTVVDHLVSLFPKSNGESVHRFLFSLAN